MKTLKKIMEEIEFKEFGVLELGSRQSRYAQVKRNAEGEFYLVLIDDSQDFFEEIAFGCMSEEECTLMAKLFIAGGLIDDPLPSEDQMLSEMVQEAVKKNRKKLSAAARTLGHYGGEKGGPARAKKLSPKRRKEIARQGARARWK